MAEQKQDPTTAYSERLACPLCLDVFKDATLLGCGHTFCRRCLKRYEISHRELDHMVCPVCRKITKWQDNRVDDLPSNQAVNDLIDELHSKFGGPSRPRRDIKCTACKLQVKASTYCKACDAFMCELCLESHQNMSSVFEGHEVQSLQDIIKNINVSCPTQDDMEEDMQLKVDELMQQCRAKVAKLKDSADEVELEEQRSQIHAAMQKLQDDIRQAYEANAKQLAENQNRLVKEIKALGLGSNSNGDANILD